jgi:hypothetical protein
MATNAAPNDARLERSLVRPVAFLLARTADNSCGPERLPLHARPLIPIIIVGFIKLFGGLLHPK